MSKHKKTPNQQRGGGSSALDGFNYLRGAIVNFVRTFKENIYDDIYCYEHLFTYIIFLITFYVLPLIVFIISLLYTINILSNMAMTSKASFYGDTNRFTEVADIVNFQFFQYSMSTHNISFIIILSFYTIFMCYLLYNLTKKIKTSEDPCPNLKTRFYDSLLPSIISFGLILIILIVNIVMFNTYNKTIGNKKAEFDNIINDYFKDNHYIEYLKKDKTRKNNANTIKEYVQDIIAKPDITEDNRKSFIKKAYFAYGILKTIQDNNYTKININTDNLQSDNLFLSINISTNKLINLSFVSDVVNIYEANACGQTQSDGTSDKAALLKQILTECDEDRKMIDEIVMEIKNTVDNTTSGKTAFVLMLIPVMCISLILIFGDFKSIQPAAVQT